MSLSFGLYAVVAVLAAFGCVLAVLVAMREVKRVDSQTVMGLYLWAVLFAPTLNFAFTPRNLSISSLNDPASVAGWVTWLNRVSSVLLMCVAAAVILNGLSRRQAQPGAKLFVISLILLAVSMTTSATLGEVPMFVHNSFYPVVLMASILMLPRMEPEQVAAHAKRILLLIMIGSLVMVSIAPNSFAETNYVGIIPGFHIRLYGLAPHANALGPLAVLYLLLAAWVPGTKHWQHIGVASAVVVLVLVQSKTNWIAALLMLLTIAAFRLNRQFLTEMRKARPGWATWAMVSIGALALLAVASLLSDAASGMVESAKQDKGLTTLTGRTDIWRVTIETWLRNPLFGYGPSLWDFDFRMKHGMNYALHAHNQYMQTLGEAGLMGLVAISVYSVAFIYYGFRFAARTGGVSLALMLHLLVRTTSEIPMRLNVLLDTTFFPHLVVFAIFLMLAREDAALPPDQTSGMATPLRATA